MATVAHRDAAQLARGDTVLDPGRYHHGIAQEQRRFRVAGPQVQVHGTAGLNQAALAHDGQLVSKGQRLGLVVGDQDGGDAGVCQQACHGFAHGRAQAGVQCREGLIQ
ncbi:hypothetical protein D3C86_1784750 [compost metagenome]